MSAKQWKKENLNSRAAKFWAKDARRCRTGAIGRKVAASAKALGMEIVGYDPYYVSGGEGISVYSDLGEMLSGLCDYVTLHLPANDSTKGMMNAELFDAMKDGTVLLISPEINS